MKYIAHRGLVNNTNDNSYLSLKKALESPKYIGIETDLRTTKDKKIILYHDLLILILNKQINLKLK